MAVKHRVPQRLVLGSLLFIIYPNDHFHYMNPIDCVLFADDTTMVEKSKILKLENPGSINKAKSRLISIT